MYEAAGAAVRGLEGSGDHAIFLDALGVRHAVLHSEVKRYAARAKVPEWWRQCSSEAPHGAVPVLHTRADRGEWLVTLRLYDFVGLLGE